MTRRTFLPLVALAAFVALPACADPEEDASPEVVESDEMEPAPGTPATDTTPHRPGAPDVVPGEGEDDG